MSRRLRFIPEERTLVEVTTRTVHGRYLLRPSPLLDEIVIGVLARAVRKYGARCIGFAFVSSHYHLLLEVDSAFQLARLMNYFNSKLAKEIGRLTGWRDKIWSRRYQAIPVSQEDAAQIARLKYILSHGVKEFLCEHLRDWPGVHAVRALVDGEVLEGRWFDRSQEYAARRRGEKHDRLKCSTLETLTLEPLPCWKHLEPERRRELIAALVKEIEDEAAAARKRDGVRVAGADAVLAHHPHDRPEKLKKGPAPLFHAATAEMRKFLWSLYAEFVGRFRDAAEKLRVGDLKAVFPPGCFPPALPFVPGEALPDPRPIPHSCNQLALGAHGERCSRFGADASKIHESKVVREAIQAVQGPSGCLPGSSARRRRGRRRASEVALREGFL